MRAKKPPQWQKFDRWMFFGALVGLGVAFGVFCLVQIILFRNFAVLKNMHRAGQAAGVTPSDILTMTATALGGLTIGGVAVMQYRKHKWAEYQAKMDEDSRTGERLEQAIEHLGNKNEHIRIGALYEFRNLAEDSPRNKENIVQILTAFVRKKSLKSDSLLLDGNEAARILAQFIREFIEETAEKSRKRNKMPFHKKCTLRPPECIFIALGILARPTFLNSLVTWRGLKTDWLDLDCIDLNRTKLIEPDFKGTRLCHAYFYKAFICKPHFEGADLTGAHLKNADIVDIRIDEYTKFDPGVREKYFPDFGKEKESGAED